MFSVWTIAPARRCMGSRLLDDAVAGMTVGCGNDDVVGIPPLCDDGAGTCSSKEPGFRRAMNLFYGPLPAWNVVHRDGLHRSKGG